MSSVRETEYLLNKLLKEVSRSFFLTLKFLPRAIRPQIGLAYLLARATDTIADTEVIPVEARLEALQKLRDAICRSAAAPQFQRLADNQSLPAEKILLDRVPSALKLLRGFSPADQERIQQVLDTITSGQELDLVRFRSGTATDPMALQAESELDDYTFRVAGCVGDFWTQMCLAHLKTKPTKPADQLIQEGIRFGKGLQLVNILRDIPADLRRGRCYLPESQLGTTGVLPKDLLDAETYPRLTPVFSYWLARAEEHLAVGWEYTNSLPYSWMRVRLACAWPILIGQATLRKLAGTNVLDSTQRVKVGRQEVKTILVQSVLWYPFPGRWRALGFKKG